MNQANLMDGETLCKECGLCCTGVFHPMAFLYTDDDINIAKKSNLNIISTKEDKFNSFSLPCPAFDGSCSIYNERPSVCPKHQCDLLKSTLQSITTLEDSLKIVNNMKSHLDTFLPTLKSISNNMQTNEPFTLMGIILKRLKTKKVQEEFKKDHQKMLMKITIFDFLKKKYFYKK